MAFAAAAGGRPGPAVLLCPDRPARRAGRTLPARPQAAVSAAIRWTACWPTRRSIDAAAELLASAERPLVVAGGGVHLSDATRRAGRCCRRSCSLPVATTTMGKGAVDERHPLSLGVIGYFMGPGGMARHQRSWSRTPTSCFWSATAPTRTARIPGACLPRAARFIHLDIDGAEIGRNYEALRLVGDAKLTLAALTARSCARDFDEAARGQACAGAQHRRKARERIGAEAAPLLRSGAPTDPPGAADGEIWRSVLAPTDIVVADASYASIWIDELPDRAARRACGSLRRAASRAWAGGCRWRSAPSWPRPTGRCVCLVRRRRLRPCLVGAGDARAGIRLPVTVTVLNNGILGYQKHAEDVQFGAHTTAVDFPPVDHAAIARACGVKGVRVEDPADYAAALAEATAAPVTTVIDVIVDPEAYPPISSFEGKLPLNPQRLEQSGA